jgi:ferredoxin
MPTVTFVNEKKSIEVPAGSNLRREAIKAGIQLYPFPHNYLNCLGNGLCTSCKVIVKKGLGNCSPPSAVEKFSMVSSIFINPPTFFARLGHETDMRLACQMKVEGDIEVQTQPAINWHGENFFS